MRGLNKLKFSHDDPCFRSDGLAAKKKGIWPGRSKSPSDSALAVLKQGALRRRRTARHARPCPIRLGIRLQIQHLPALVMAAVWADPVRHDHGAAVRTRNQSRHADGIVGAAAVAPSFADFSFW